MTKIIRILRSCSMKIFCKFPTVNISKLNYWLVICIAKNFIWTTLKMIFSIFWYFCTYDWFCIYIHSYSDVGVRWTRYCSGYVFIGTLQSCKNSQKTLCQTEEHFYRVITERFILSSKRRQCLSVDRSIDGDELHLKDQLGIRRDSEDEG